MRNKKSLGSRNSYSTVMKTKMISKLRGNFFKIIFVVSTRVSLGSVLSTARRYLAKQFIQVGCEDIFDLSFKSSI